jgi:predicted DNA-binding transcriptional regulator YafY
LPAFRQPATLSSGGDLPPSQGATEKVIAPGPILELLADAAQSQECVEVEYNARSKGRDIRTVRVIEPEQVFGDSVIAFCRLRQAEREFRLQRIAWARRTGERFS